MVLYGSTAQRSHDFPSMAVPQRDAKAGRDLGRSRSQTWSKNPPFVHRKQWHVRKKKLGNIHLDPLHIESLYIYILINFHHQHIKIYQIIIYMMLPNWRRPPKILASYPYCCLNHLYHLQFCCLTHPIFGGFHCGQGLNGYPKSSGSSFFLSKLLWTGSKFTMCLDKS